MKHNDIKPMTPFDILTQDESMRMLKLMIPFLDPSVQKMLAVYMKYAELQNTIRYFRNFDASPIRSQSHSDGLTLTGILEEIRPYMSEQEGASIDSILSAFQMMEMMSSMNQATSDFDSYNDTEETDYSMKKEDTPDDDELDGKSPVSGAGPTEAGTDKERCKTNPGQDGP